MTAPGRSVVYRGIECASIRQWGKGYADRRRSDHIDTCERRRSSRIYLVGRRSPPEQSDEPDHCLEQPAS